MSDIEFYSVPAYIAREEDERRAASDEIDLDEDDDVMSVGGYEVTYSKHGLYVKISDRHILRTIPFHNVNIDVDYDGGVVGIELMM